MDAKECKEKKIIKQNQEERELLNICQKIFSLTTDRLKRILNF